MHKMSLIPIVALAVVAACSDDTITNPAPDVPQAAVVTATGNIAADVDAFRNLLGASNGGTTPPVSRSPTLCYSWRLRISASFACCTGVSVFLIRTINEI